MCYARRQRLSWARIKLSKYDISRLPLVTIIPSLSALLTLLELFFKFKRIFGVFYFSSLLFNFQGASLSTFWRTALLLYQNRFPLSSTFLKFFQIFWSAQSCSYRPSFLCLLFGFALSALADSFVIISILLPFVNRFFHLFSPSTFLTTPSSSLVLFCAFGYKRKRSFYLSSFCFIT